MGNAIILDTTKSNILEAIQTTPVSSSGMDTTFVGPLSTLLQNPYTQQNLSYPRDLGSTQKLHSVQFRAIQVSPTDFNKVISSFGKAAEERYNQALKNGKHSKKIQPLWLQRLLILLKVNW
jgi:hypothetical protein